jgi:hypothetical protein
MVLIRGGSKNYSTERRLNVKIGQPLPGGCWLFLILLALLVIAVLAADHLPW